MAVFNTARLRDVLVRGRVAQPAAAMEFVDELETQMDEALSSHPSQAELNLATERTLRALAEMEARLARQMNQTLGIMLAGNALAVGIILGFS